MKLKPISFLAALAAVFMLTLWLGLSDRSKATLQPQTSVPEKFVPSEPAIPMPSTVASPALSEQLISDSPQLPWKYITNTRPEELIFNKTELYRRLNPLRVLASREATAKGQQVFEHLLETGGKYPQVVLMQSFPLAGKGHETPSQEIAYVADHVLVQPVSGQDARAIVTRLAAQGYTATAVGKTDLLRVALQKADLNAVGSSLAKIRSIIQDGAVVEPDYLVFPADVLDDWHVSNGEGRHLDPERQAWVEDVAVSQAMVAPTYAPVIMEAQNEERLAALPPGARVIGFDLPHFRAISGGSDHNPYLLEQNFGVKLSTGVPGGMYIQNALNSGYPNNGTYYARSNDGQSGMLILHKDRLPFTLHSVDLSEYSTAYFGPGSIRIKGYKADNSTVQTTCVLDNIIDGTGPLADFQTFTMPSNFTDLVLVEILDYGYQIDNIVVTPVGQETPLPAPPVPPLVYDITWDNDPHKLDLPSALSGPYAPTTYNFDRQYVRSSVGALTNRPLEMKYNDGQPYSQFQINLELGMKQYVVEFDMTMPTPGLLSFFIDGKGGFYRIDFGGGAVTYMPSLTSITGSTLGTYVEPAVTHVRVELDISTQRITIYINNNLMVSGGISPVVYPGGFSDWRDIRFSLSGGVVGLDNVKVWAETPASGPAEPELTLTPSTSLSFPATPVNGTTMRSVRLRNDGTANLLVNSINSNSADFVVTEATPITVTPGGVYDVNVKFKPSQSGLRNGTLALTCNDSNEGTSTLALSGEAYGTPVASLSPAKLYVTMLPDRVGTQFFTISNTGSSTLNWSFESSTSGTPPAPLTPDDPSFSTQWSLRTATDITGGIDAPHAWRSTVGDPGVKVAVIDTGIDAEHPDLAANVWTNTLEIAGNGIDDDHNGFIDDVHGWNFYTDNNNPADGAGHGTHVSGTIAARGNNSVGISGVAWQSSIVPIKFLSDQGSGYTSDAIQSVDYARTVGARIINASWGGGGFSTLLQTAIQNFITLRDGIFVAAAGNNYSNNDAFSFYPASYSLGGIISVAATDASDTLASFSNYGSTSVDLGAPGVSILSTLNGNRYGLASGTSMAAPHTSGALALLLSYRSSYTGAELRRLILDGADNRPSLFGKVLTEGRLNAYNSASRAVDPWIVPTQLSGAIGANASAQIPLSIDTHTLSPGNYMQALALRTNDPVNPKISLPVDLTVKSATVYNSWAQLYFSGTSGMLFNDSASIQWGSVADADNDGVANMLEYLTGSDPTNSSNTNVPITGMEQGVPYFIFETLNNSEGVSYSAQWSPDLSAGSWTTTGLNIALHADLPAVGRKRWKATFTNPAAIPAHAFFRLNATSAQ